MVENAHDQLGPAPLSGAAPARCLESMPGDKYIDCGVDCAASSVHTRERELNSVRDAWMNCSHGDNIWVLWMVLPKPGIVTGRA
jgi:hypothetical protein